MNKPPVFLEVPESQEVVEEERLELKCWAHGKPMPEITWFNGDKEIAAVPGVDIESTYDEEKNETQSAVIIAAAAMEDEGKYRVEASNKVSTVKHKFDIIGMKTNLPVLYI